MQAPNNTISSSLSNNLVGIMFMLMAVVAGLITASMIKSISAELSILAVLTVRFILSLPLLYLFGLVIRGRDLLQINRWDILILRMTVGHLGIIFWFLSISYATLGQATALFQSSAIFVTVLAPIMLGERVGIYRGSAVITGLIGVIMITNPFTNTFNIGLFWGIMSAFAGAFLVIFLRILGKSDAPISSAIWHNSLGAVVYPLMLVILFPAEAQGLLTSASVMLFIILGIAASFVQLGFSSAYRYGEAVLLVPVRYLSVPLAAIIGWIFWQEQPGLISVAGMLIVIASCLFISFREYRIGLSDRPNDAILIKS